MKFKVSKNNICKYKVMTIVHSGRKGIRYEKVNDDKYNSLIGHIVICKNLRNLKEFDTLKMTVENSKLNKTWETSPIISLQQHTDECYYCETFNSIYVLKEIEKDLSYKYVKIK